jgi:hypothetical protein
LENRILEDKRRDVEENNDNNKEEREDQDEVKNKENLPLVSVLMILINVILKNDPMKMLFDMIKYNNKTKNTYMVNWL